MSRGLWLATDDEFDEAVEDEADPGVDQQAPVEVEGLVAGGRGQVRHEDEEVEQAAEEDGGELFENSASHDIRLRARPLCLEFRFAPV